MVLYFDYRCFDMTICDFRNYHLSFLNLFNSLKFINNKREGVSMELDIYLVAI